MKDMKGICAWISMSAPIIQRVVTKMLNVETQLVHTSVSVKKASLELASYARQVLATMPRTVL